MFDRKIPPMLAYSAAEPFDSRDHIFEVKWDGTRCILFLRQGEVRLQNRRLLDITHRYPELVRQLPEVIRAEEAILDGELVVLRGGRPHFPSLQQREHVSDPFKAELLAKELPATYIVFDLLLLNGQDCTCWSLLERKEALQRIVTDSEVVLQSRFVEERGKAFYEGAIKEGFEGVMAKRKDSPYLIGKRSRFWLKVKPRGVAICHIVGYTEGEGQRRSSFGALVLATREGGRWTFRGKVGTGFKGEELKRLKALLSPLRIESPPFEEIPHVKGVHWVEPLYRCEVLYHEETQEGRFRAPVFRRLLS